MPRRFMHPETLAMVFYDGNREEAIERAEKIATEAGFEPVDENYPEGLWWCDYESEEEAAALSINVN